MVRARNLAKLPSIRHGFFGRRGGVSQGPFASLNASLRNDDDPKAAWTNRTRIAGQLHGQANDLWVLRQVHGTEVVHAQGAFDLNAGHQGDALMAREAGPLLGVSTADCAPILIADPQQGLVGAAHAGWRGALAGISDQLVAAMERQGAERRHMVAAIGPCIAQASYEVGLEFEATFLAQDAQNQRFFAKPAGSAKPHFDLKAYLVTRLSDFGVGDVEALPDDTLTQADDYFSYRRACLAGERQFGLQLSVITLS